MALFYPARDQPQDLAERLRGSTLVVPTVSHGNVPQLALDVLLTTLLNRNLVLGRPEEGPLVQLVGFLHHPAVLPIAGNDALVFEQEAARKRKKDKKKPQPERPGRGLNLPVEVWHAASLGLTLVHQRSPLLRSRAPSYIKAFWAWAREVGFGRVCVLSSGPAQELGDALIQPGEPQRYHWWASRECPGWAEAAKRLGWRLAEPSFVAAENDAASADSGVDVLADTPVGAAAVVAAPVLDAEGRVLGEEMKADEAAGEAGLPLGGFAQLYVEEAPEETSVALLTAYCYEGDNSRDGLLMAAQIAEAWVCPGLSQAAKAAAGDGAAEAKSPEELGNEQAASTFKLVVPSSWSLMFGGPPPAGLYL